MLFTSRLEIRSVISQFIMSDTRLSIAIINCCIVLLASPKAKQKLVDNKITHILSIHDAAEPGDGVSSLNKP